MYDTDLISSSCLQLRQKVCSDMQNLLAIWSIVHCTGNTPIGGLTDALWKFSDVIGHSCLEITHMSPTNQMWLVPSVLVIASHLFNSTRKTPTSSFPCFLTLAHALSPSSSSITPYSIRPLKILKKSVIKPPLGIVKEICHV